MADFRTALTFFAWVLYRHTFRRVNIPHNSGRGNVIGISSCGRTSWGVCNKDRKRQRRHEVGGSGRKLSQLTILQIWEAAGSPPGRYAGRAGGFLQARPGGGSRAKFNVSFFIFSFFSRLRLFAFSILPFFRFFVISFRFFILFF